MSETNETDTKSRKNRRAAPQVDAEGYEPPVPYIRAVGLEDGESLEGRYLGFDVAEIKGKPRCRHHFDVGGDVKAVFGAAMLDTLLLSAQLGRMTLVIRKGPMRDENGNPERTIEYEVRQKGKAENTGLIGRAGKL